MLGAKPYHFEGDVTKVVWARCLAKEQVIKAVYEARICMIIVEIIMGHKKDGHDKLTPVIAHPRETMPDWDVEEFLRMFVPVIEDTATPKGIKLEFKCKDAMVGSLPTLRMIFSTRKKQFPLWLHCDIFPGPGARDQTPVDPTSFILEVAKFPEVVISLGWTTSSTTDETGYTSDDIDAMLDFLNHQKLAQPVTVMIRATLIAPPSSFDGVIRLMHGAKTHTSLTVWSSPTDHPDVKVIKRLLKEIGHRKVYLELPLSTIEEIRFEENYRIGSIP